jgi:hypothetical protein
MVMKGHMALLRLAWASVALACGHAAARARGQHGQTASEYMGLLLLIALVISALLTLDVDGKIVNGIQHLVNSIGIGDDPNKQ